MFEPLSSHNNLTKENSLYLRTNYPFFYKKTSMAWNLSMWWKWKWSRSVMSDSLWPHGHQALPSMGFSRQEYWSGLPFPSSGNFVTQGLNPGLPHCRQMLYRLSHQGSPRSNYMLSIFFLSKTPHLNHQYIQCSYFQNISRIWLLLPTWLKSLFKV